MLKVYVPYQVIDNSPVAERDRIFKQYDRILADDIKQCFVLYKGVRNGNKKCNF